jgi:peroxiredoxin/TRAP-type C4-dicarboxylate transport system permease small subunit
MSLRIADITLLAVRLLLAAVFLLAGATKLVDPVGLRKALRDFGAQAALARPMVPLLPMLELAVAAALLPTGLAWYGAWGALALLTVFLIAVGIAMLRGRHPDCHCFGQLHSAPAGWSTLIRNTVLAACAAWMIWMGRRHAEPDLWAWLVSLDSRERRVAIVVACVAAFCFFYVLDRARPRNKSTQSPPLPAPEDEEVREVRKARPAPVSRKPPAPARIVPMGIGLPIGTPAPEFELPTITGEKRTLRSLREGGNDLLLVFSSPFCDSCVALTAKLLRSMHEMEGLPSVVLLSCGTAQDNLAKMRGFEASRVLLQRDFEVSEAYDCCSTPSAVLVGADGLIRSSLAMGGEAIEQLLSSSAKLNGRLAD